MNSYEEHEKKSKCRHFYYCEAQFCPMAMVENTLWYPDEAVCDLPEYSKNVIIRNQKNIKKKHPDPDLYFSYRMLNRKFVIGKGIKGVDPDLPGNITSRADTEKIYRQREDEWIAAHPVIREEKHKQLVEQGRRAYKAMQAALINEGEKDE